MGEMNLLELT